jgi:hypothetical protein
MRSADAGGREIWTLGQQHGMQRHRVHGSKHMNATGSFFKRSGV